MTKEIDYPALCVSIRSGDLQATEVLYDLVCKGKNRNRTLRQLHNTEDVHDVLHQGFVIVWQAVMNNKIEAEETLPSYIGGVTSKLVWGIFADRQEERETMVDIETPSIINSVYLTHPENENTMIRQIFVRDMVNEALTEKDRELVSRTIFEEQSDDQVMSEMNMSPTQLRVAKHRAKRRLLDICHDRDVRQQIRRQRATL